MHVPESIYKSAQARYRVAGSSESSGDAGKEASRTPCVFDK